MSDSTLNNYVTSALSFCAKLAGTDESEDHTFYARNIGIGSVVLDLGGNQGKFSSYMVNKFPCTVYAVEPSPELYAEFPRHERIHSFQLAISGSNDSVTFYLSDMSQANSTNKDIAEFCGLKKSLTVQGVTLPAFLEQNGITNIDLLKIDIEGAEFDLFDSVSDKLLRDNVKQITVEFHDFMGDLYDSRRVMEIKDRLESLGYLCVNVSARYGHNSNVMFVNTRSNIQPISWIWLKLMQKVYRHLAARQMRVPTDPSGKTPIVL